jgi:hypothetical protein
MKSPVATADGDATRASGAVQGSRGANPGDEPRFHVSMRLFEAGDSGFSGEGRTRRGSRPRGITLLEVVVATLILIGIVAAVLRNIDGQAKVSEDTEKLQMATKILQSIKEELMAVRFRDFRTFADRATPDESKEYLLDDMFYPHSRDEVLKFQQRFRDFSVRGRFKFVPRKDRDPKERTLVYAKLVVSWNQPNSGPQSRSTGIMIVEPKS